MTAKTRANFKTDKDTALPDNTAGDISAADLRGEFDHAVDSAIFPEDLIAAGGAALVGIEDTGTHFTGTTVEAALAEIGALLPAEANADVTDTANVTAAGALMDSEVTNLAAVKAFDPADYAAASHTHTASDIDAEASTDGYVLTSDGAGNAAWEAASGSAPEGTAVLSTGETGGTKFLREDGDGTCSWQVPAGSGDVSKVGTPADGQVGVWTGDGTIEGTSGLTYTGSVLEFTGGLLFNERADHAATPGAAKAELWVSNDTAQKLYFTDDAGTDNEVLTSGSGATLTDTAIATGDAIPFFDATDGDNPKQRVLSSVITDLSLATQSDLSSVTVEGTAVLSTGETGGTKYLREDGDGTCSWQAVAGGGDVSKVGTPADGQIGVWTGDGTIEGDASLTFDTTDDTLVIAASGKLGFGAVDILSDSAGTTTLQNIDALDATTEATIEAAIDTLANLTSVQGHTITLTGDLVRSGAHSLTLTTTGATNVTMPTSGTLAVLGANTFTGAQDFGGNELRSYLNDVITLPGSGPDTLTAAGHSGNVCITAGNVVIPTTAGFSCILISGGAHTVTFNGTTSAAMAAGDIMTIAVQSSTVIHAVLTAAADKVSFA